MNMASKYLFSVSFKNILVAQKECSLNRFHINHISQIQLQTGTVKVITCSICMKCVLVPVSSLKPIPHQMYKNF